MGSQILISERLRFVLEQLEKVTADGRIGDIMKDGKNFS